MTMQATGMGYTVPLSRVIFLPMSMFGMMMAAFISVFVGTDFSDGVIRNKLLISEQRHSIVISHIIVNSTACVITYILVTAFTAGIGHFFFENDVNHAEFLTFFLLGLGMSLSMGCIFSVMALFCGSRTHAVIVYMGIAFVMLGLCMYSNDVLAQAEYKDGMLNPYYTGGNKRKFYEILHDLNPYGQAAQLSSWNVPYPIRTVFFNLLMMIGMSALGCKVFQKKDLK